MVWIQIIGIRRYSSIDKERNKVREILSKIEIDLSFLKNSKFPIEYNPENWILKSNNNREFFEYKLGDFSNPNSLNSIRIIFSNDQFIEFSGPFEHFASWYNFADNYYGVTDNWRRIFKLFSIEYGLDKLFYFAEDFYPLEFIYDDNCNPNDLFEEFESTKSIKKEELYGLSNFHEFYEELLN